MTSPAYAMGGSRRATDVATRAAAWLIALAVLALYLATTARHGVGVSLDSVVYARAAESVVERGTLDVPLTEWSADESRKPLKHFPPAFPLALAAIARVAGVDTITASRWLNAACVFATTLTLLLTVAANLSALGVMIALLAGPSFITVHLWAWSEPLFLLFTVIVVRLLVRLVGEGAPPRVALLLGLCAGLATLTRYAGVSLFAGAALAIAAAKLSSASKLRHLSCCAATYALTIAPWLWWLATRAGAPREIGLYPDRLWWQGVRPFLRTTTSWFVPRSWPLGVAIAIVLAALAVVAVLWARRARADAACALGPLAYVATTLLAVHVAFLVLTRLVADPGMPFDERVLVAALVLTALGLSDIARTLLPARPPLVAGLLVAGVAFSNASATRERVAHVMREGLGYTSDRWRSSETIAWLRRTPPGVTIYSNAPDAIAASLPITVKYTPAHYETEKLTEFVARARVAPAMVVLFDDPHAGWLMPREKLLALPGRELVGEFSDSVVVSWHSPLGR